MKLIKLSEIEAAYENIKDHVVHTPLLKLHNLSDELSANIYVKAENLQHVGAFKLRGAYNTLSQLSAEEKKRGVVACSSGNHAAGVALAAHMLGIEATIVMPHDAPPLKIENTRQYGADIVFYDRKTEDREAMAREIAEEKGGAKFIHPFNDPHVICGQATVGIEIIEQMKALNLHPDEVIAPLGGGGLASGVSTVLKSSYEANTVKMTAIEPIDYDDAYQSMKSGKIESINEFKETICDALLPAHIGDRTFAIMKEHVDEISLVDDEAVKEAVFYLFKEAKLVVEPGGAVALAHLLKNKEKYRGKNVVMILSGGNMSIEQLINLSSNIN